MQSAYAWGRYYQLNQVPRLAGIPPAFYGPAIANQVPIQMDYTNLGGADFVWVTSGIALGSDGNVYAWNSGSVSPALLDIGLPLGAIRKLQRGLSHYMALDNAGNLWVWGSSQLGALGNGADFWVGGATTITTPEITMTGVTDVTCAENVSYCAIGPTLYGCGWNNTGQLLQEFEANFGEQSASFSFPSWLQLDYPGELVSIQAQSGNIFLLLTDNTILGAGLSTTGNLGYVQDAAELVPGYQPQWHTLPFTDVESFGGCEGTVYVKHLDGTCESVGFNNLGLLGAGIEPGATLFTASPQTMQFPVGVTVEAWSAPTGFNSVGVAVGSDGLVYTWGTNAHGTFGNGLPAGGHVGDDYSTVPVSLNGLTSKSWVTEHGEAVWAGNSDTEWMPLMGSGDEGKFDLVLQPDNVHWTGDYIYNPYSDAGNSDGSVHAQVPFFQFPYERNADGHWHPQVTTPLVVGSRGGSYVIFGGYVINLLAVNPATFDPTAIHSSFTPYIILKYTDFPITIDKVRLRAGRTGAVASSGNLQVQFFWFVLFNEPRDVNPPLCTASIPLADLPLVSAANNYTRSTGELVPRVELTFDVPMTIYGPPLDVDGNPLTLSEFTAPPADPITGIRGPLIAAPTLLLSCVISTTDSPLLLDNLVLGCLPVEVGTWIPRVLAADYLPGPLVAFSQVNQGEWSDEPHWFVSGSVFDGAKIPSFYVHVQRNAGIAGPLLPPAGAKSSVQFIG